MGSATSINVLIEANISKTDLLIAVTSDQETNIATAIIGKLGAKRTIARISNIEFLRQKELFNFNDVGIDELISPELLAAHEIKGLLKKTGLTDTFEFDKGILSFWGLL